MWVAIDVFAYKRFSLDALLTLFLKSDHISLGCPTVTHGSGTGGQDNVTGMISLIPTITLQPLPDHAIV